MLTHKQLKQILKAPNNVFGSQDKDTLEIQSLEFDSRKVNRGSAFFCIRGEKADGHEYIQTAFDQGADIVIADELNKSDIEKNFKSRINNIIFVNHVRKALAEAANAFYGDPGQQVNLIGVTGTNGKTTVTHLIAQVVSDCLSDKVGLIGTLGAKIFKDGKCIEFLGEGSGRTTPEATELQETIQTLKQKGCKYITMEVSSHALEQGRVHSCNFNMAVFTNLTQDHLDYHVTMEKYFNSKAILFEELLKGKNPKAIINTDSNWAERLRDRIAPQTSIITYGIESSSPKIKAENINSSNKGITATITYNEENEELHLPLNGIFNLYNALSAIGVAVSIDSKKSLSLKDILKSLEKAQAAPGRFEVIKKPSESLPTCIVDYAHTPDGLENVLKTAKQIVPKGGKLVSVFGCGGDRDPTKRPIMGKISSNYANISIVTSDNPRTEDPNQIIADILTGIEILDYVEVEVDRATAIERAITESSGLDIVVIAGKGHEDYQIFPDKTIHFLDSEEVEKAYSKMLKQKV
ncbi:MAG: UDP-N-acetylmuramoyl-L-alanyl-D-glutamate--2,6-diaminopimelate ligase [Candidatus Caenarcaniphilales bacterium]|nr:UDP-N-acetylmuramoyl-L-alanyl-D-glutamate--2,6-diaminopimelate ligase [Candidatus Caenarcaniphilales bacterium]